MSATGRSPWQLLRILPILLLALLWAAPARGDMLFPALPATSAPEQAGARLLHPRSQLPADATITTLDQLDGLNTGTIAEPLDPAIVKAAESDPTAALFFLPAGLRSILVTNRMRSTVQRSTVQ